MSFDSDDQHRRLVLEGRHVLERTSASLARSNQVAIETENIGHNVISDLSEQRETLLRTQRRLEDANAELTQSNVLLRRLKRGVLLNKAVLVLIIVLEALILASMLYSKFR